MVVENYFSVFCHVYVNMYVHHIRLGPLPSEIIKELCMMVGSYYGKHMPLHIIIAFTLWYEVLTHIAMYKAHNMFQR